jgi:thiamine-monophosphate kinase
LAARHAGVNAMMDLSDGLGLDFNRLADASRVGFVLTDLPIAEGCTEYEAIGGGEDYELVITTADPDRLIDTYLRRGLRAPIAIGLVVRDVNVRTLRGEPLPRAGWQHEL